MGMPTGCLVSVNRAGASPAMQSKMAPWAFVLAVPDINKTAQYFRDFLGFRISWENATDWRLAERDGVRIMLGQCPTDMHPSALGSHNWFGYLDVNDVDGLHAEFTARGAVCSAPAPSRRTPEDIERSLNEIAMRVAALPVLDSRSTDEIIGYDEFGVPR